MRVPFLVISLMASAILSAAPAIAKDKKPEDPDKRICRSDIPTGSIMPERECHKASEWKVIDDENARNATQAMAHSRLGAQR